MCLHSDSCRLFLGLEDAWWGLMPQSRNAIESFKFSRKYLCHLHLWCLGHVELLSIKTRKSNLFLFGIIFHAALNENTTEKYFIIHISGAEVHPCIKYMDMWLSLHENVLTELDSNTVNTKQYMRRAGPMQNICVFGKTALELTIHPIAQCSILVSILLVIRDRSSSQVSLGKRGSYLGTKPNHRKGRDAAEPREKRNQGFECSQGVFSPASLGFSRRWHFSDGLLPHG